MWTVATIIDISKYSLGSASLKVDKGALFGPPLDPALPAKILIYSEMVNWAYDQYGETDDVKAMANFLYTLCDPALEGYTQDLFINGSSANNNDSDMFPIHINQDDFESDGLSYNDPRIVGKNLSLFMNDNSQTYIYAGTGFNYTATGIQMLNGTEATVPGFDANTNNYDILIFKITT